ncbi:hypothetical protein H5410_057342 [Solanum commersonii]|uniref:Uncharacterized protein n=1 Tax=Solanum commersonii TaxID=4109 RepID=A0A9J5WQB2_SOLCO|nr:hypothetical protein H5410_057342 [Solanum commersonii]
MAWVSCDRVEYSEGNSVEVSIEVVVAVQMCPKELVCSYKKPEFVQQQLKNHSSPQLLTYTNGTPDDPDHDYCFITLISEENPQTFKGMTHLKGSVDGLFLMYGTIDGTISCTLWNPATREVRPLLLPLPAPIIHDAPVLGFGLDPLTND